MNDFAILRFFPFITFSWKKKKQKNFTLHCLPFTKSRYIFRWTNVGKSIEHRFFNISFCEHNILQFFFFLFFLFFLFLCFLPIIISILVREEKTMTRFFSSLDNRVIFILHSYLFLKKRLHLLHLLSTFIFFIIFSSYTLPSSYNFCWWLKTKTIFFKKL